MFTKRTSGGTIERAATAIFGAVTLAALLGHNPVTQCSAAEITWGTHTRPFASDSLWNSRPVAPVFGSFVIPTSVYAPLVGEGAYSLGVFLAKTGDPSVTVYGLPGGNGVWDSDSEVFRESVTVLRWPADATPATGSDGHMDIVDAHTGVVHSFFKLRRESGRWVAQQYAWTRIDGSGWGDPAHYFQGARATGVASMAGLIRKHEVSDGDTMYRHALALSLTYNALATNPGYVFPATSADGNAATTNSGAIPEGALLMLPPSFNTLQIANPELRKVAETLKTYGAYVVDRNYGTPFYIYVENGSGFNPYRTSPTATVLADLDRIRLALRHVVSAGGWTDGGGKPFIPQKNLNLLSMRGPWLVQSGPAQGEFDTFSQALVFKPWWSKTVLVNYSSRFMNPVWWAKPVPGATYRLSIQANGNARLQVKIFEKPSNIVLFDSGELGNGQSATFTWPSQAAVPVLYAFSGGNGGSSSVRGQIMATQ